MLVDVYILEYIFGCWLSKTTTNYSTNLVHETNVIVQIQLT
jgi:hypothetical protein